MPSSPALFVALTFVALAGCQGKPTPPPGLPAKANTTPVVFPELGPGRVVEPGVTVHEVTINRGGVPMKVWVYLPQKPVEKVPAEKLALVLVPPAGSTLCVGMALAEGDRPEHYPYVKAGFAVVAFEIDGHVANTPEASDAALVNCSREFRDARAGLDNAKAALDFALAKVPTLDTERVYVAGHSSAATLALFVAEFEPRVKACAAYAPCPDVASLLAPFTPDLESDLRGFGEFLKISSPQMHAEQLNCPLFLFYAEDDTAVRVRQSVNFYERVRRTNSRVTLVKTATGGHYNSMIREGVPKAIALLKALPKA